MSAQTTQGASRTDAHLASLSKYGLRDPDEKTDTYAKWKQDGATVTVYFGANGALDLFAEWLEPDGRPNRLVAPRSYEYLPWLARDVARALEDPTATRSLGPDYQPACPECGGPEADREDQWNGGYGHTYHVADGDRFVHHGACSRVG